MRRRARAPKAESSEEEDEEDAFSALSRSKKRKRGKSSSSSSLSGPAAPSPLLPTPNKNDNNNNNKKTPRSRTNSCEENIGTSSKAATTAETTAATSSSTTSSNKRHHHMNSARQAKMDALLDELNAGKDESSPSSSSSNPNPSSSSSPGYYGPGGALSSSNRPPPDKMGSFVQPGEEHLTTNIFVGNLAPSVTEEALTDAFRQFGDLYSVKIMWPRTPEERARNRNTGFVCFMNRDDAQEAMDAFQDADPLRTGRRLTLRWGKNVKKTVKRGTGGVPIPPIRRKQKGGGIHRDNINQVMLSNNDIVSSSLETKGSAHHARRKGRSDVDQKDPNADGEYGVMIGNASSMMESTATDSIDSARHREQHPQHPLHPSNDRAIISSSSSSSSARKRSKQLTATNPNIPLYDPAKHAENAIRVIPPSDPHRLKFITTVASFVAKDGSILEKKLIEKESGNPKFSFLQSDDTTDRLLMSSANKTTTTTTTACDNDEKDEEHLNEIIFYRWRVFAFAQNDGFDSWRTQPFIMVQPHGRFWIPPSIDQEAARREEEAAKRKEDDIRTRQEVRRKLAEKKDFMTGRQLEHAKFGSGSGGPAADGGAKLNKYEQEQFEQLLRKKLCASRDSICDAMAFCFDKSGAALQISEKLKEAILEDDAGISVETRIARLYLLSDVLFNSQQPGVKNAFRYRDSIEEMAPEVFKSLGRHGRGMAGRMTMNKLRNAVSAVLSAWTNWSVYNPMFLDELHAHFEGKDPSELVKAEKQLDAEEEEEEKEGVDMHAAKSKDPETNKHDDNTELDEEKDNSRSSTSAPRGGWTESELITETDDVDGEPIDNEDANNDIDGEQLAEDDIDGEQLDEDDIDGEPIEDVDGEVLGDDDIDGEELPDNSDVEA